MQALIRGVRMCKPLGFGQIENETDSELVVGWVTKNHCNIWYLWDFWKVVHKEL